MIKKTLLLISLSIVINAVLFSQSIPDSLKDKLAGLSQTEQINYLNKVANEKIRTSPAIALELAQISYQIAVAANNKNLELNCLLLIGRAARLAGKNNEAIDNYNKAITILNLASHNQGLASTYNDLGLTYKDMGRTNDAISSFEKSLNYYEQLKDNKSQYLVSNNLGAIYSQIGQHNKAIEIFKKGVKIAEILSDNREIASSYNQLGVAYSNYGNFTEANKCFNKAKEIASANNLTALLSNINSNIASLEHNIESREQTQTTFDVEKTREQEEFVATLKDEFQMVKIENLKSMEEISNLTFENQAKELKLHVLQGEYEKQLLENQLKEQEVKLLESENLLAKAEIERKQEAINYQRKVIAIIIGATVLLFILLIFIYRLYVAKKKTLKIVQEQKDEIQKQKDVIQESIEYAKHIQQAIIPSEDNIKAVLPGFFAFLKPRDVVSGDFFWYHQIDNRIILAAVDCTGHGVAGGLMSMIGNSLLNKIIKENKVYEPCDILQQLNNNVVETLAQSGDYLDSSMDITICSVDYNTRQIAVSLAGHHCIVVKNGEVSDFDGSDYEIGGIFPRMDNKYEQFSIPMEEGINLYMYSDGFPDQDNDENKKFGSKAFVEMITKLSEEDTEKRTEILNNNLTNWMGSKKQRDDVVVIGFKI